MSNNAVLPMLDAGIDVALVNPNRDQVYDRPTAPSLSAFVAPDRRGAVTRERRALDRRRRGSRVDREVGVSSVAAGGFAEMGDEGRALQARLVEAAGPMAIVGPNCSGFMNVRERVNLFTGGRIALHPGPVSVVSQSGFLLRSTLAAGQQRQLGFGIAVSSGNEAVTGLHDYVELLADDPETRVICLVIEKIRDAERFLAAVRARPRRRAPRWWPSSWAAPSARARSCAPTPAPSPTRAGSTTSCCATPASSPRTTSTTSSTSRNSSPRSPRTSATGTRRRGHGLVGRRRRRRRRRRARHGHPSPGPRRARRLGAGARAR